MNLMLEGKIGEVNHVTVGKNGKNGKNGTRSSDGVKVSWCHSYLV